MNWLAMAGSLGQGGGAPTAELMQDAPRYPGPDRRLRQPKFELPPGTVDCHAHIFGPNSAYPFSPERNYTPEDCTVPDYKELLDAMRIDRCVIVNGGAHGTDNRVTVDALHKLGNRARGVAVIRPGLKKKALQDLHDSGVRGCRISTIVRGGAGPHHLEALASETHSLGWHVLLHLKESAELCELAPRLRQLPNAFVIDHLGHVLGREGASAPGFSELMSLLKTGRVWVKLASLYRSSSLPYPHADMLPMIRAVVSARPDRVIWGTNWPHPIHSGEMPNDADLVDLLPLWIPDEAVRTRILVDNPAQLYGFGCQPTGNCQNTSPETDRAL